jgi:hypothetical protein
MKNKLLALALITGLVGIFGAAYASIPEQNEDPAPMCGKDGAACLGNADCCGGFSCHDEGKRRACRPD